MPKLAFPGGPPRSGGWHCARQRPAARIRNRDPGKLGADRAREMTPETDVSGLRRREAIYARYDLQKLQSLAPVRNFLQARRTAAKPLPVRRGCRKVMVQRKALGDDAGR